MPSLIRITVRGWLFAGEPPEKVRLQMKACPLAATLKRKRAATTQSREVRRDAVVFMKWQVSKNASKGNSKG